MKKFSLFMMVLLLSIYAKSQTEDFICATEDNPTSAPAGVHSGRYDQEYLDTFDPVVFNIFFWQVNAPNGYNGENGYNEAPLSERLVLEVVANLNIEYNPYNIFFKYRGYGEINSPQTVPIKYYDYELLGCVTQTGNDVDGWGRLNRCQTGDLYSYASINGYLMPDAFNVFVPFGVEQFGGSAQIVNTFSFIPTENLLNYSFIHEIGHNFGLNHPFSYWYRYGYDYPDPTYENCEHVTRDPEDTNDPNIPDDTYYNALSKGDKIHDTSAMPDFKNEYCVIEGVPNSDCYQGQGGYAYEFLNEEFCTYITGNEDCQNTEFEISEMDVRNIMTYTYSGCRNTFSIGQGIYMLETIEWDLGLHFSSADTPVSSLYEHYKGEYYASGPEPDPLNPPLFQPGFNYKFISCSCDNVLYPDCDEPCPFWYTAFQNNNTAILSIDKYETDYSIITHPNHTSIYIDQLSEYEVRRCYDNWNKAALSGNITKFNDNVFNTNVTITPKDSTGINNQNLINELPQGLYKIEKNYDDGTTKERVIFKENN